MKKSSMFILSVLMCLAFNTSLLAQKANKPPSGCGADALVSLTVANGYNITSDGSVYANGGTKQNQISSVFQIANCSYDFILNLNSSTRYLVVNIPGKGTFRAKFFNSDRIASVPVTTNQLSMQDFCGVNSANNSYKYDNYGGCGSDEKGAYVRRNIGFDLGDGTHNLRFQYSPIDNPAGNPNVVGTSFIKVYHPDSNTWILEPEGTQTGVFLTNGSPESLVNVSFSFVVKK